MVLKDELEVEGTVDLHGNGDTLLGHDLQFEVHTSNNLSLRLNNGVEGELPVKLLSNTSKTSLSSLRDEVNGRFLGSPATDNERGVVGGVNTEGDVQGLSLSSGETLRDLVLNTAQIDSASHLEVTLIGPGGVPRVSQKPVVLVAFSSPSNQLDAMTSN